MVKHIIDIDKYWRVIVYYNINYNSFNEIVKELLQISSPVEEIDDIYFNLKYKAKAVTCSNINKRVSIVLFNKHKNKLDYINSIVHEAEHIKQHMLMAYNIKDSGEDPAYTIGYIVMKMLEFNDMLNDI